MSEMTWQERDKERAANRAVFDDMISGGLAYPFFGVDGNVFKLGDSAFEVLENEDDGYRSSMDHVRIRSPEGLIFFGSPVDSVRIVKPEGTPKECYGLFTGWQLVSAKDGHVWLTFGTENCDDYYPSFCVRYSPRL